MTPTARFRVIKPKPFDREAMWQTIHDGIEEFAKYVLKDFDQVTDSWTGARPEWKYRIWGTADQMGFSVNPMDEESEGALKWLWLDKGTGTWGPNGQPYRIPKEGEAHLAFPSMYNAGSQPGSLNVGPGSSSGDLVFASHVMHPGIQPRDWSVRLAEDEKELFSKWMTPVMKEAARASGHGVD